eukprot:224193-Chlamydomonas_euryale.AAC.1
MTCKRSETAWTWARPQGSQASAFFKRPRWHVPPRPPPPLHIQLWDSYGESQQHDSPQSIASLD